MLPLVAADKEEEEVDEVDEDLVEEGEEDDSILARTTASLGHFFLLCSRHAAMASGVLSFGGRR
jgi:hypothetical protein